LSSFTGDFELSTDGWTSPPILRVWPCSEDRTRILGDRRWRHREVLLDGL